jgi:hypothetical protein
LSQLKVPQALNDVYRDLRDRRLLVPAVALLVALVAVPMLLKTPDEPAPPAPVAVAVDKSASPVSAAVLADTSVGVRNYRKRLDALKSKNPFKPQFVAAAQGDGSGSGSGAATNTSPDTSSTTPPPATTGEGAAPPPIGPTPSSGDVSTGGTGDVTTDGGSTTTDNTGGGSGNGNGGNGNGGNGNGGNGNQPSSDDVEVVNHLFTRRVDLMIGLQGDPKLHENVKPMTILPNNSTAVVAFLGTDEKGQRAAFVVSKDATMVAGDGACVPSPEACLYITLEKNETATLDFGPDGQTFDLRLLEIRDHQLPAE